jgi:hypothetical protein
MLDHVTHHGIIGEVSNGKKMMIDLIQKTKKYQTLETVGCINLILLRNISKVKQTH